MAWIEPPTTGQLTIAQLHELLMASSAVLDSPPSFKMRTVAIPTGTGRFAPFARRVDVAPSLGDVGANDVAAVGSVLLVTIYATAEQVADLAAFHRFLSGWVTEAGVSADLSTFQETLNHSRNSGYSRWSDRPAWVFDLCQPSFATSPAMPRGPFFNAERQLFGTSVGDLAAAWLQLPELRDANTCSTSISLVLPDYRARLAAVRCLDQALVVEVESDHREVCHVALLTRTYDGVTSRLVLPVHQGKAQLPLSSGIRDIEIHLLSAGGIGLDSVWETATRASRFGPLLFPPRSGAGSPTDLIAAVRGGESETMELKAWIPLERERSKAAELFKTICAFANTAGGTLLIGVSDELEIVGVNAPLMKLGSVLDVARDAYLQKIRRFVNEAITPQVPVQAEWLDNAGLWVLRLTVETTASTIASLVENGSVYVRRGANNKRADPSDIARLMASGGALSR